jgi:hypothetical protein
MLNVEESHRTNIQEDKLFAAIKSAGHLSQHGDGMRVCWGTRVQFLPEVTDFLSSSESKTAVGIILSFKQSVPEGLSLLLKRLEREANNTRLPNEDVKWSYTSILPRGFMAWRLTNYAQRQFTISLALQGKKFNCVLYILTTGLLNMPWIDFIQFRSPNMFYKLDLHKSKKNNAIPITGSAGPYGCEILMTTHCLGKRITDGGKVGST